MKLCAVNTGIIPSQNNEPLVPVRVLTPTIPIDTEKNARSNKVIFTSIGIAIISVLVCLSDFGLLSSIRNIIFILKNAIKTLTTKLK